MADTGTWSLEIDADRVAWLVCDTPGTSTNVLSATVLRDLAAQLADIAAQRPVGAVIRSAKAGGFIAGADIKEFLKIRSPEEGFELVRAGQAVLQTLADLPCPSVAALHGFALGAGLELALACTYRGAVGEATSYARPSVRRDQYPAPYAILDLWQRHGAAGAESYEAEARSISQLMCTPTSRNLVRVFLLQDRLKSLGGKSPADFRHVHVIGAGVMGGDIAAWSAFRGLTVTLQDRSEELIQPALDRAKAFFDRRLKDPAPAQAAFARWRMDVKGDGVAESDVVIEAIFETLDAKRALYAELEPKLKPDAILATNTSSIRIETLCEKIRY